MPHLTEIDGTGGSRGNRVYGNIFSLFPLFPPVDLLTAKVVLPILRPIGVLDFGSIPCGGVALRRTITIKITGPGVNVNERSERTTVSGSRAPIRCATRETWTPLRPNGDAYLEL